MKRKVYTRYESDGTPGGWSLQWALIYPVFEELFEIVPREEDAEFTLAACINDFEHPKKPVILVSLSDYCGLNKHYQWWLNNHQPVAAIISHGIRPEYRDQIGSVSAFKHELPVPELHGWLRRLYSQDRVFIGPTFSCWPRLEPLYNCHIPDDEDREYDIYFAGTVTYSDEWIGPTVTVHRRAMMEACANLPYARKSLADYRTGGAMESWEMLKKTRITPSAWGWGCACHRDTEAVLCGSRVVKPFCGWLETYPDIYGPDSDFFTWCDYSWNDLPAACEEALAKPAPDREKMLQLIAGWREHFKNQVLQASQLI